MGRLGLSTNIDQANVIQVRRASAQLRADDLPAYKNLITSFRANIDKYVGLVKLRLPRLAAATQESARTLPY